MTLTLTLLGGFLGAGKTTWLRHHLHQGLKTHVLINEAAGLSVDDALLSGAQGLTQLAGGCACCVGLPGLIKALRDLADQSSQGLQIPDLTLETSGLADPAAILQAISADPILTHHIRIRETLVLVDAETGLSQGLPDLALTPLRAANRLILTKPGSVPPQHLANLAASLAQINPLAQISAAEHGTPVPLPDLPARPLALTSAPAAMLAHVIALSDPDWPAISLWLSGLLHGHGDHILRIKGVIRSPAGRLLIQTVRRSVQPPEILPEGLGTDDSLAFIGHGFDPAALDASLKRFLG